MPRLYQRREWNMALLLRAFIIATVTIGVCGIAALALDGLMRPAKPCPTLVPSSQTCIPFGCKHTFINKHGGDTGECE